MELAEPFIFETKETRHFLGAHISTNFIKNETAIVWQKLMPQLKSIQHRLSNKLYAIDQYPSDFNIATFKPEITYTKMACVEITGAIEQNELQVLSVPNSLFAVFTYTGTAANAGKAFHFIFTEWENNSNYCIDFSRPIICEMEANYNPTNEKETELIWIPIKTKNNAHSNK